MAASAAPSAPVATSTPSAAVTALNAQREANVSAGKSAYTGTAASLSAFTSANPATSTTSPASTPGSSPANPIIPTPSGGGNSSVIVTSNQSRGQYADNVTNLNNSLLNASVGKGTSIVDYLNKSGMPSDYASRATLAAQNGINGYTGSAQQNLQLLSALQNNSGSAGSKSNPTPTATSTTQPAGATAPANADGSTTDAGGNTTYQDGTVKDASGNTTTAGDPTAALPPALAAEFKQTLAVQDQNIQNAQDTLTKVQATLADDPAAQAAAASISDSYGTLISAMQTKNTMVIARAQAGEAAFGGLGVMPETFMSDEMDAASSRIGDLVTKEQDALLKSNTAYEQADVKTFNDAMTALNTATNDKKATLSTLLTATNDQVKNVQAQQKIDAATSKATLTSDVTTSAKIASGMAEALASAGITDPDQIAAYVQAMATKNGITNTDILNSALVTAQAANTKANVTNAHTEAETNKVQSGGGTKTKGGTDAGYTYTAANVTTVKNLLKGGGGPYAAAGSDGYSDPGAYLSLMQSWTNTHGGSVSGFAKLFPPKTYINPASYSELPKAIQPKAASASAQNYQT